MLNNSWFKKEAPLFTGLHFGFGGGSGAEEAADTYQATGGSIDNTSRAGYNIHTFTSPGTFQVTAAPGSFNVELLMIAGGGAGGNDSPQGNCSGGGGAGELYYDGTKAVGPTGGSGGDGAYPVTIGAGGAMNPQFGQGGDGGDTSFGGSLDANGGGGGGVQQSPS